MPTLDTRRARAGIALAASILVIAALVLAGGGPTFAQDASPTPEPAATETPTPAPTDTPTTPADTGDAAPAYAVGDSVLVADGPLNLRAEPGLDSDVVLQLSVGARLQITGSPKDADGYTWFEVLTAAGDEGWVAADFITTTDETPAFAAGDAVTVVDGPLNVRADAALDADVTAQLEAGDTATVQAGPISADEYTWYQVETADGATGWVAGEFLAAADGNSGDNSGNDGGTAAPDFAVGDALRADVDGMNFRADAGLDAEVLDTIDAGALFVVRDGPVSADGYTWYQVFNYYYGEGWVAGELMVADPNGFPGEGGS